MAHAYRTPRPSTLPAGLAASGVIRSSISVEPKATTLRSTGPAGRPDNLAKHVAKVDWRLHSQHTSTKTKNDFRTASSIESEKKKRQIYEARVASYKGRRPEDLLPVGTTAFYINFDFVPDAGIGLVLKEFTLDLEWPKVGPRPLFCYVVLDFKEGVLDVWVAV